MTESVSPETVPPAVEAQTTPDAAAPPAPTETPPSTGLEAAIETTLADVDRVLAGLGME